MRATMKLAQARQDPQKLGAAVRFTEELLEAWSALGETDVLSYSPIASTRNSSQLIDQLSRLLGSQTIRRARNSPDL